MPQGGIDAGEDPRDAAMRELWEETGVNSADYLGETDWLTYEFPPYDGPPSHRLAKFRGQRQKWFALRFTGRDDEIDPLTPRNGQPAEFEPGAGSGSTASPISWCRSGARSISAVAQQFAPFATTSRTSSHGSLIDRPDRERADRDDVAIAVALGAIGERALTAVCSLAAFRPSPGRPAAPTATAFQPVDAIGELARDVVPRIGGDRRRCRRP